MPTRRRALAMGALLLVVLTGCGDADDDSGGRTVPATTGGSAVATSQADHDEADVRFSMMMVPHHLQAVEMANLVTTRSTDPDLLALAARIAEAQSSEVAEMTGWLGEWGASPDEHLSDSEHMAGMEGMMTDDALRTLATLQGDAFRTEWLTMMIAHHEGALDLAGSVLASGTHAGTKELATAVLRTQQQEIDDMRAMLAR